MAKPTMQNWRQIVGARIRRLAPEQAREMLAEFKREGVTIFHPTIRALTGGLNSQSINTYVTRKLAIKAGMLPPECK